MELYDAVMTTRAMRRLTNDPPVTAEEIERCLRAAAQAPSGGNVQPWHFVVVTDPDQRAAVADVYQRAERRYMAAMLASLPPFRSEAEEQSFMRGVELTRHLAEHLADTPFVLFCLARYENTLVDDEGPIDIGSLHASIFPAVQNFMLAARDLGLGTTLTTVFRAYHDEVKELVGLREHHDIVALVPIGRPEGRFGVAPRKPIDRVVSWNRYGERRAPVTPEYPAPDR
jgi:nitroreductase